LNRSAIFMLDSNFWFAGVFASSRANCAAIRLAALPLCDHVAIASSLVTDVILVSEESNKRTIVAQVEPHPITAVEAGRAAVHHLTFDAETRPMVLRFGDNADSRAYCG
jgi:hypothetical protein